MRIRNIVNKTEDFHCEYEALNLENKIQDARKLRTEYNKELKEDGINGNRLYNFLVKEDKLNSYANINKGTIEHLINYN